MTGRALLAVGLAALCAACGAPGATGGPDERGPTEPAEHARGLDPEPAALRAAVGTDVTLRDDGAFGLDRVAALDEASAPGPAFRVSYPAGSVSPSAAREHDVPEGGAQVYLPRVEGPLEEAHLRYWVRLSDGFAFAKGGKLPGLWGGSQVSGGEEPDGTDGFSTRLMWRAGGAGEVYLYATGRSGASLGRGSWKWPVGRWVCVEQHVALDRPGRDDGRLTVRLDGVQVFEATDVDYRTVESLRIEGIFFSTFFGGDDPSWASPRDQHADFAAFALSPRPVGCDPAAAPAAPPGPPA